MNNSLLLNIKDKHILVIGDVMLDNYIEGRTDRISPEAPVPIVSVTDKFFKLGGAANVSKNIKSLGAKVTLLGVIGDDAEGETIHSILEDESIESELIADSSRKTTSKLRIIGPDGHLLRIDNEDTHCIEESIENELLKCLKKKSGVTGIVISDYDKGVMTPRLIFDILKWAKKKDLPVYVDPKHRNFWRYEGVRIFKPNLKELSNANKGNCQDIEQCLRQCQKKLNADFMMCTMSELGIAYLENDNFNISKTETKSIVDVSGAGDTVMAVMVLSDQCGVHISEICRLSNKAGGLVCQERGVVTLSLEHLMYEKGKIR